MSLLINKAIFSILSENVDIVSTVSTRLYPIVATQEDTPLPFIVFQRKEMLPNYTKDACSFNMNKVVVTVLSKDYAQSVDLAQEVRSSIEGRSGTFNGVHINRCRVAGAVEMCDGEVFVQEITFDIVTA